jgi:hypothetical protein
MGPLHEAIGRVLIELEARIPGSQVILSDHCGGREQIRLYGGDQPDAPCIVYADAAVVIRDEIKVVIEVEESNLRPLHLCGKVLGTAVSTYHRGRRGRIPLSDSLLFIQIFVKESEDEAWSKLAQCHYLENKIRECLPPNVNRIKGYYFHYGTAEEYNSDRSHGRELLDEICGFFGS